MSDDFVVDDGHTIKFWVAFTLKDAADPIDAGRQILVAIPPRMAARAFAVNVGDIVDLQFTMKRTVFLDQKIFNPAIKI